MAQCPTQRTEGSVRPDCTLLLLLFSSLLMFTGKPKPSFCLTPRTIPSISQPVVTVLTLTHIRVNHYYGYESIVRFAEPKSGLFASDNTMNLLSEALLTWPPSIHAETKRLQTNIPVLHAKQTFSVSARVLPQRDLGLLIVVQLFI